MEHRESVNEFLIGVSPDRRDAVTGALSHAFGRSRIARLQPIRRGASGASVFRVDLDQSTAGTYLLRVEGPRSPTRNPHQYVCMQWAADAGIAPPIRYVDADAGVVVMAWIAEQSLGVFPGGAPALARELGGLVRRLQQTAVFPELRDYAGVLERLLTVMRGRCVDGLLERHAAGFARLRAAYPWNAAARVSSHNDLNPHNMLFDGQHLWLVDWETAYRNDAFVDVATVAEHCAATPALEGRLLEAWSGGPVDATSEARLRVMRVLTRLYYAGLLLMIGTAGSPESITDLSAPSEAEFRHGLAAGTIAAGGPEAMTTLGKMHLAKFIAGVDDPDVSVALRTLGAER